MFQLRRDFLLILRVFASSRLFLFYRPSNCGLRFSTNAATPSFLSLVA